MKKNSRIYTKADNYMLQTASVIQVLFRESIADFTAFDPTLNLNYANEWQNKIEQAYSTQKHSQLKSILAQKTDKLQAQMAYCRTKYKEVKFFATKAFNNKEKHLEAFGTKQYNNARTKPNYMIAFMDELNMACIKFTAELLAAGMSQTGIDEVIILKDKLFETHTAQETCTRDHVIKTQERVQILNDCYLCIRQVSKAAMLVYEHDFARKRMYIFKPSKLTFRMDKPKG